MIFFKYIVFALTICGVGLYFTFTYPTVQAIFAGFGVAMLATEITDFFLKD